MVDPSHQQGGPAARRLQPRARCGVTLRCGFCEEPRLGHRGLVGWVLRGPTLAALCLTPALGLHRLMAGGMRNGDVLQAGWGLPTTSRRLSAMLPLSVRLKATSPARDYPVPDSEHWADQWAGFRLDGPGG